MHTYDMTSGNILKHIIKFAIPIALSGVFQVAYTSIDSIIVGKFAGDNALAAVGSATPIINWINNIFLGLSAATNITVARQIGAKNKEDITKTVHTAITTCIITGVIVAILGILFAKKMLRLTCLTDTVAGLSTIYMRIYLIGVPAFFLYNFGSAVLYATGDTKRPAIYAIFSGIINVILNVVFVTKFEMSVSGVAIATVISQFTSALLVFRALANTEECYKVRIKKLRIYGTELRILIHIGLPASFQSMLVASSNVIVQTCINKCGDIAIAGSTVSSSIEGIIYIILYSFFQAAMTFTSQNCGIRDFERVKKGFFTTMMLSLLCGLVLTQAANMFSAELIGLFTTSEAVINAGMQRMKIICSCYFLYGLAEVANGALRGTSATFKATEAGLIGDCIVRLGIVCFGMPYKNVENLSILFYSFPISWIVTGCIMIIFFFKEIKKKLCVTTVRKDEML